MIGLDLSLANALGLGAGVLIILVGAFVLAVKPNDGLHRLFFLLALTDGMSTLLFDLSYAATDPWWAGYFHAVYWWFFIAFVALLITFGLVFPRPMGNERTSKAASAVVGVGAVLALGAYVWDHGLYYRVGRPGGPAFGNAVAGNLVAAAFAAAAALIILKLTADLRADPSESHRRQAAYVLGGMALAYVPFSSVFAVQSILVAPVDRFVAGPWDVVVAYWTFLAVMVAVAISAVLLAMDRRPDRWDEHRFVLATYGGILALTLILVVSPTASMTAIPQRIALLAYPILLGYAIARYNVFDIEAKVRRATAVTMTLVVLGLIFVAVQELVENLLVDTVFAGIPVPLAASILGAVVVAGASVPIVRVARRGALRFIPELTETEAQVRKLEIYRHSVEGSLRDQVVDMEESETLRALREHLGISEEVHHRIVAEVLGGEPPKGEMG